MNKQQSKKYFLLILLIAVLVVPQVALATWWNPLSWGIWNSLFHRQTTPIPCTKEAKLCPDGLTTVGRQGPKCEFAECPKLIGGDKDAHGCLIAAGYSWCETKQKCLQTWEEKCEADATVNWKTYTNSRYGFSFKYPKDTEKETLEIVVSTCLGCSSASNDQAPNIILNYYWQQNPDAGMEGDYYYTAIAVSSYSPADGWTGTEESGIFRLDLKSYVQNLRKKMGDKNASNIVELNINGQKAYQFASTGYTGDFHDFHDKDYKQGTEIKHLFTFLKNKNGDVFQIEFPIGDDLSQKILNTLEFTK